MSRIPVDVTMKHVWEVTLTTSYEEICITACKLSLLIIHFIKYNAQFKQRRVTNITNEDHKHK
jgi:hypothetical protein